MGSSADGHLDSIRRCAATGATVRAVDMAVVETVHDARARLLTVEHTRAISAALWIWVPFVALSLALLTAGRRNYPDLHVALDMAMALLPAVLAWLLWHIGSRVNRRFPQLVSVTFALAALLNFAHLLVAVELPGMLGVFGEHAASWRPATWGPTTHLLPLGILFALRHAGEPRGRVLPFGIVLTICAALLLVLFANLPAYSPATLFGITRPSLVLAPLAWMAVAWMAFQRRANDRIKMPTCLMAMTLAIANFAMLYSQEPHDSLAMVAHLGRIAGYLVMLISLMHLATADMQARLHGEAALADANADLEARVEQRTAELARTNDSLMKSELRLRAFVSATSDVVYRMSPDWSEMRALLGQDFIVDTSEPDNEWLQKYIHPADQELVTHSIREAIRKKDVFQLEHRVIRVDGTLGWTFSRAIPMLDDHGEIVEWFGAASDVTARREAEEKSRAQVARLSLLDEITRAISERHDVDSIFQVVIRTLEGSCPWISPASACTTTGKRRLEVRRVGTRSEALAMELSLPEQRAGADRSERLSRVASTASWCTSPTSQHVHVSASRRGWRAAGCARWSLAPLRSRARCSACWWRRAATRRFSSSGECEFLRQLSEHVALAAHQAQLYSALQQAYDDLRQTQQTVMQQERLRALGQMASGIAHDINNAISPVALYTECCWNASPR